MNAVRDLLAQYGIRPRKRLGQSFLADGNMIRRIAELLGPAQDATVVEIGAGLGLLTAELARQARRVVALEIDPRLVAALQDRFAGVGNVEIVAGDVLKYDFSLADPAGRIHVVGNVPYYIATPILFRLIAFRRSIASMVLMFQKELADRLTALPGGKAYGIPTVIVNRYAAVSRALSVPAACFYPEPEVASAVLRLAIREEPATEGANEQFRDTVRAAFASRRKTLRNNLQAAGYAADWLEGVFVRTGIEGGRRAETLSVEEFGRLSDALAAAVNSLDNRGRVC